MFGFFVFQIQIIPFDRGQGKSQVTKGQQFLNKIIFLFTDLEVEF